MSSRPPVPPFTPETAAQKARMAEDAWNTRDPARVALAYTVDSHWRNRTEFVSGREAHDREGQWFRSYGNELWEFDDHGLMRRRVASINDLLITEADRKYHWPLGRRPDDHAGLSELGL